MTVGSNYKNVAKGDSCFQLQDDVFGGAVVSGGGDVVVAVGVVSLLWWSCGSGCGSE